MNNGFGSFKLNDGGPYSNFVLYTPNYFATTDQSKAPEPQSSPSTAPIDADIAPTAKAILCNDQSEPAAAKQTVQFTCAPYMLTESGTSATPQATPEGVHHLATRRLLPKVHPVLFENGQPAAQNRQLLSDGSVYVGSMQYGRPHGEGYCVRIDGSFQSGTWINGALNGPGVENFPANNSYYVGEFYNGLRHGEGTFVTIGSEMFEGTWSLGELNGHGTHISTAGQWKGLWLEGRPCGFGRFTNVVGDAIEGNFYQGLLTGRAIITYNDGGMLAGMWVNCPCNGDGFLQFDNGRTYYGSFKGWMPCGNGIIFNTNNTDTEQVTYIDRCAALLYPSGL